MEEIRMNKGSWGKVRAFFDFKTSDGLVVKGFKLIEGIDGMFVGLPSQQDKDGEYYPTVNCDKEVMYKIQNIAEGKYAKGDSF